MLNSIIMQLKTALTITGKSVSLEFVKAENLDFTIDRENKNRESKYRSSKMKDSRLANMAMENCLKKTLQFNLNK